MSFLFADFEAKTKAVTCYRAADLRFCFRICKMPVFPDAARVCVGLFWCRHIHIVPAVVNSVQSDYRGYLFKSSLMYDSLEMFVFSLCRS